MSLGLPSKAPPKRKWISLSSALTWLAFDHAFELADLLDFAGLQGWSDDELQKRLNSEWHELRDYACEKSVRIRAWQRFGHQNVELTTEDLANFVHVGCVREESPFVALDRFPFTFSGGFQRNLSGLKDGFFEPVVWRADLVKYKRLRSRTRKSPTDKTIYGQAELWLQQELSRLAPQTGHRLFYIGKLMRGFGLPRYRAQEIWTKVARSLHWPERGRPRKNSEQKTPTDSGANANFV